MDTSTCSYCGKEKPVSEFHKNKSTKTGLATWCIECRNEYMRNRNLRIRLARSQNTEKVILRHEQVDFISCEKCMYLENGKCRGFLFDIKRPESNGCTFGRRNIANGEEDAN